MDALDLLLKDQPQQREDEIRAELDRIAGLSERDGWAALEERCRAEHIDLDAREGPEDAVFMLALDHADVFEQIVSAASLKRRNGGRDWSQFGFLDPATSLTIDDPVAREEFVHRSMEILKVAAGRRYEADWYDIIREDPATWQHLRVSQVTIYVEERPEATLAFDETSTVQRRVVPKVAEVSFGWDHEHALFDVCAAGGFSKRSEYATALCQRVSRYRHRTCRGPAAARKFHAVASADRFSARSERRGRERRGQRTGLLAHRRRLCDLSEPIQRTGHL